MACKFLRDVVSERWGGELTSEEREHARHCPACQAVLRQAALVQAGFQALTEESVPEASLGFTSRLLRRLQAWEEKSAHLDFFETVGRRFVYATLALTLVLLLSLLIPNSGPVRGVAGADFLAIQTVSQSSPPDVIGGDVLDSHEWFQERRP